MLDGGRRGQSGVESILGDVGHAHLDCFPRVAPGGGDAIDEHLAAGASTGTADRLGQLALAVAGHTADSDNLTGAHAEVDPAHRRPTARVVGVEIDGTEHDSLAIDHRAVRVIIRAEHHLATHHQVRQFARRRGGGFDRAHIAAIAQHRDTIGDGHHLVEFVRDEHHRTAGAGHRTKGREQRLGLLRSEHCGGLIEDQHGGLTLECLQDLDPLLFADGQLPHLRRWVDRQAELLAECADALLGLLAAEGPFLAEHDVLGDGERGHQMKVLVHHSDPARDRVAWRRQLHPPTGDVDRSRIRVVQTTQDIGQCGFPRTVLPE
ncbi:unannotated protein [freshwater metagenome]|uniref:Unannotated protein n=1 Tax=freshwater metagenome TaxID=449393 RepID=A0A6J6Z651_9ZZZZ